MFCPSTTPFRPDSKYLLEPGQHQIGHANLLLKQLLQAEILEAVGQSTTYPKMDIVISLEPLMWLKDFSLF